MKIVFVLGRRSIDFSGGFRVIAGYADRLCERGHQVTILAPGGAPERLLTLAEKIRRWLSGGAATPEAPSRPFLTNENVNIETIEGKDTVSPTDFPTADILVATWWETAEWVHACVGDCARFHLVQDHEIFPYLPIERAHAAHRLPLRKIVVSRWIENRLVEFYGIDNATLIENAVDYQRFDGADRAKPDQPIIGFVYSGAERKNSARAILACCELKRRIPNLRVLAFGSMPPKRADKMPRWVDYLLTPTEARIAEIYGSCSAWLFTSDEEGFGLPILEAMASGTPVIATPAGAAPQIVTEDNGALVGRDLVEMVDQAERILKLSPEGWGKMSAAAIMTARRRGWSEATSELEATFFGAIGEQNRQNLLKTD